MFKSVTCIPLNRLTRWFLPPLDGKSSTAQDWVVKESGFWEMKYKALLPCTTNEKLSTTFQKQPDIWQNSENCQGHYMCQTIYNQPSPCQLNKKDSTALNSPTLVGSWEQPSKASTS